MHINCYSVNHNRLGTDKDERDNQVTAHEPAEKVKVSFLHNRADAADAEDAADVEQNAETKIIKRKWRDVTKFFTEESDATPAKNWTLLRPMSKSDGGDLNAGGSLHDTA